MTRMLARLLTTVMVASVAVTLTPGAASAAVNQTGKLVHVGDGDTVDVDIDGDGTSTPQRIRLTGINTPEITTYSADSTKLRGECHAVEATKRLRELALGKKVRVQSRYASSMSGVRYRRTVSVYRDGAWRDVAALLLAEGHGLWLPNGVEYLPNKQTSIAAQRAQAAGIGVWKTDYCGSGPYQSVPLRVAINWDAAGDDAQNPNGEWIKISNLGTVTVPLGGWRVRDSAARGYLQRGYAFPSTAMLLPGRSISVHPGKGTNTTTRFYWNLGFPIFENASSYPKYMGDGAYLSDPQGDVRAWQQYPCRYNCT